MGSSRLVSCTILFVWLGVWRNIDDELRLYLHQLIVSKE